MYKTMYKKGKGEEKVKTRIKLLRTRKGMTLEELGAKIGVTKATAQKYEVGIIPNIKRDMIEKLADALDTTPGYLMGWGEDDVEYGYKNVEVLPKTKTVPLVGRIACGTPILAVENIEANVSAPECTNADFALRCVGDSMVNARICDGDLVYIRKQPAVDNGDIAAVLIDDEATLKRVYFGDGKLILQPENASFAPLVFVGDEINKVRIIGKAVAFLSGVC